MTINNPDDLPFYAFFPRDFAASVLGWPMADELAYRRLLDGQWILRTLPSDMDALAKISGLPAKVFVPIWKSRLRKKFKRVKGGFQNSRLARIYVETLALCEAKRRGQAAAEEVKRQKKLGLSGPRHISEILATRNDRAARGNR